MSWEIIGGVAAGLADAKRQADEQREMREYRKEASELRRMQKEDIMRRRAQREKTVGGDPVVDPGRDSAVRRQMRMGGVEEEGYAKGGLIGASNSEMSEWNCHCASDGANADWQKASFKK